MQNTSKNKLKDSIKKLLGTGEREDVKIALNLCKMLTKHEFTSIISKYFEAYDNKNPKDGLPLHIHGWCLYCNKINDDKDEYGNSGYIEQLHNYYIEYDNNTVFIDCETYVKLRLKKRNDKETNSFLFKSKELESEFIKKNPKYEKYFRTTGGNSN